MQVLTTNQKIMGLLVGGKFSLPPGLLYGYINDDAWRWVGSDDDVFGNELAAVYSHCAMRFASELDTKWDDTKWDAIDDNGLAPFYDAMEIGDAETAISELYNVFVGEKAMADIYDDWPRIGETWKAPGLGTFRITSVSKWGIEFEQIKKGDSSFNAKGAAWGPFLRYMEDGTAKRIERSEA